MKKWMKPTRWLMLLLILVLALAACGPAQDEDEETATLTAVANEVSVPEVAEEDESEDAAPEEVTVAPEEEEAAAEVEPVDPADVSSGLSFDLYGGTDEGDFESSDSGLQYFFTEKGDGQAAEDGQLVMLNLVGWLEDGTEITNSAAFGGPIPLPVGTATGIIGLDEALTLVSTGSEVRFVIPAELVVDENGGPTGLPPGAVAFEMEVVEIVDGPPEAPQVIDENDYTVTDSGLKYYDMEEGDGAIVEEGQQVTVHYTGWLEDNTIFDSSVGRQPFSLVVGTGQVIQGWDEGLQGMNVGGRRQLVIPPDLAYGESGTGGIPPGAVLIFEVEVVDAQ